MVSIFLPAQITITGENAEPITLVSPESLVATRKADPTSIEGSANSIRGISLGVARALLRAGLPHFAMAIEILTDQDNAQKVISRSEFIRALDGALSKEQARKAFDEWTKKPSDENPNKNAYKQEISEKTKVLMDFVVKMSTINISKYKDRDKMATNSKSGKRGRPAKALIYVPSEADLRAVLKSAGFISGDMTIQKDAKLQGEFSIWPSKKLDVFKRSSSYKDFIFGYQVYQHGKDEYSRKQLTDPIGDTPRNSRRRAKRLGFIVTPNEPELIPLSDENFQLLVPKNEDAGLHWIANGRCTENDHIRNSLIGKKRFPFTWEGYRQAKETSRTGMVWKARDQMSTYSLGKCDWYTTENAGSAKTGRTSQCAFVNSNYSRCGDYATEEVSLFCEKHAAHQPKRSGVSHSTLWETNFPLPIEDSSVQHKQIVPSSRKVKNNKPAAGPPDFFWVYGKAYAEKRHQRYDPGRDFEELLEPPQQTASRRWKVKEQSPISVDAMGNVVVDFAKGYGARYANRHRVPYDPTPMDIEDF
jgi:hypothetical protein